MLLSLWLAAAAALLQSSMIRLCSIDLKHPQAVVRPAGHATAAPHYTGGSASAGAGAAVLPAAACFVAAAAAAGPTTAARHMGQVECARSQASTHSAWNACAHLGSRRTFSPASTCPRHTGQSRAAASPRPPSSHAKVNVGSAAIASALMPQSPPSAASTSAATPRCWRRRRLLLQMYQMAR
ncbi:hypothetical protein C2845_PM08G01710 [Panicum miliaceum]|uniref:Uncharacterized protein n=1 Tax=Panicum miliaceum TaxID=4540 RepID=A0A3L6QX31_PANMI|nr:hypothetical protein C2845_PM08G01710 [Panicum miliaceum]